MCFRFGSCLGSGSGNGQDFGRSTNKRTHGGRGGGRRSQFDHGNNYNSDADHGPQAYQQMPAADDEARHTTDAGARKDHVDDAAGAHGGNAPYVYVQEDKADDGKVGHDAADYAHIMARLHEATAPDRRENGAMDYHHPATATTLARSSPPISRN